MSTEVLGSLSFLSTPEVSGTSGAIVNYGGLPGFAADITANQPAATAVEVGTIFLDTTLNRFFRSNGTSWIDLTPVLLLDGTNNEIVVADGTNVTPSVVGIANNPVLPGVKSFRPPVGTTAQREASPVTGDQRFNTTIGFTEEYNGSFWSPMGRVIQMVTGNINASSGTTTIPNDNTVPTNTEGNQIWTTTFTPLSATSTIIVRFTVTVNSGTANIPVVGCVFENTTNRGAAVVRCITATTTTGIGYNLTLDVAWASGSTIAKTISARVGGLAAATIYTNTHATAFLGGALVSQYTITEVV
jgi:hypothetical protein